MTAPITDRDVRCWRCRRMLALLATRPYRFVCPKCHAANGSPPPQPSVVRVPLTEVASVS